MSEDYESKSFRNREEVMASETAGCYYCLAIFKPGEITEFADNGETALCPRCGIDSVYGSKSGRAVTKEELVRLSRYWFKELYGKGE